MTALLGFVPWWAWAGFGLLLAALVYGWAQRRKGAAVATERMRSESAAEYADRLKRMNDAKDKAPDPGDRPGITGRLRDRANPP